MSRQQTDETYEKIEEALKAIEAIEVAFLRKKFERKEPFLLSVQDWIENRGFATPKQASAVDDICRELKKANVL